MLQGSIPRLSSLSARRAWIEIVSVGVAYGTGQVALRKESVDRNFHKDFRNLFFDRSLSARRAWIEIHNSNGRLIEGDRVALRKESVDRNQYSTAVIP